jgi:hypothetical protein
MIAVVLVLAFSNNLVRNTPDFQEAEPSSSTEVEQPTPSNVNSSLPSAENSSVTSTESENAAEPPTISNLEKTYILTSNSMEPTIKTGATIVYTPVPFESLRIDDIILFKEPNHITRIKVARIIEIYPSGLATKGDHDLVLYAYNITAPFLLGKVTQINNP